jgi:DNA-binding NarL/FixJ family response regulator
VLRYLPTNLSRHEIADELSVSVNTVGAHLSRIYAKLGANDRSAAVRRARELRLELIEVRQLTLEGDAPEPGDSCSP